LKYKYVCTKAIPTNNVFKKVPINIGPEVTAPVPAAMRTMENRGIPLDGWG
jgi:hypothetical protein